MTIDTKNTHTAVIMVQLKIPLLLVVFSILFHTNGGFNHGGGGGAFGKTTKKNEGFHPGGGGGAFGKTTDKNGEFHHGGEGGSFGGTTVSGSGGGAFGDDRGRSGLQSGNKEFGGETPKPSGSATYEAALSNLLLISFAMLLR